MKKIAVACDGKTITGHFGHCENFTMFTEEDGKIVNEEVIANPGHKPGFLPNFLHEQGANVVISGGMGGGAIDIFEEHGIEVVIGIAGEAKAAVEKYIEGDLVSTGSACHEHSHSDECGNH